jgi:hypothetical protein
MSMFYNGEGLVGPNTKLALAIRNGDRAEAWFQIRYQSNANGDLQARRHRESDLFGLYNDEPSLADYKSVYQMFTLHRNDVIYGLAGIDAYEAIHLPLGEYSSIAQALSRAKIGLIAHYGLGKDIDGEVLVGEGVSRQWLLARYGSWTENDNLAVGDRNDLLLGESSIVLTRKSISQAMAQDPEDALALVTAHWQG